MRTWRHCSDCLWLLHLLQLLWLQWLHRWRLNHEVKLSCAQGHMKGQVAKRKIMKVQVNLSTKDKSKKKAPNNNICMRVLCMLFSPYPFPIYFLGWKFLVRHTHVVVKGQSSQLSLRCNWGSSSRNSYWVYTSSQKQIAETLLLGGVTYVRNPLRV